MSRLVLSIGIAVTFLTVWGVIMVGSYLLRDNVADAPAALATDWVSPAPDLATTDLPA
jgi:hypothetical protein